MSLSIPEPAVSRQALVKTAGLLWLLAGLVLFIKGIIWLQEVTFNPYFILAGGIILGLVKSHYILSRLAKNNIERIHILSPQKEKICIFAFQAIKSYLIVVIMIAVGVILRKLDIPISWLSLVYLTIGSALTLSSLKYFSKMPSVNR